MVIVLLFCLVAFACLAALVFSGWSQTADLAILHFVHLNENFGFDIFFSFITNLGDPLILLPIGLITGAILFRKQQPIQAIMAASMLASTGLATTQLKTIFDRARPELWHHTTIENSFSFPSGHAATSMILACLFLYLARNAKQFKLIVFGQILYVVAIGLSRLYLGVHYPTDIIGGWLTAMSCALIVLLLASRIRPRSNI